MKNFKTTSALFIMLALFLFTSCNKDEFPTTGTLEISFVNGSADREILISPAENTDIVLFRFQATALPNRSKELNIGNYFIRVNSDGFFGSTGFQISSGTVTKVRWDANNTPQVE